MIKKKDYSEMPFSVALKQFPVIKSMFPSNLLLDFASDENYIVRISNDRVEVGYKDDAWFIGAENA